MMETASPVVGQTPSVYTLSEEQITRLKDFNNSFKLGLYLLYKLPGAWFMGVRVKTVTPEKSEITLPYGWRSQNPYNSIYFAAQAAAAEFSTGCLATLAIAGRGKVSMLVSDINMTFTKKATSKTTFTCQDGSRVFETVERAISTKEPQTIVMTSVGVQESGEVVSTMTITWTFKAK